jgi:hypothetical protein
MVLKGNCITISGNKFDNNGISSFGTERVRYDIDKERWMREKTLFKKSAEGVKIILVENVFFHVDGILKNSYNEVVESSIVEYNGNDISFQQNCDTIINMMINTRELKEKKIIEKYGELKNDVLLKLCNC